MEQNESSSSTLIDEPKSDTTDDQIILSEIDARVLGCLMEKQHTTPDQYPLTQNSLVLACNQKSSREPRMSLTDGEVGHCLRDLESRSLVKVDMGARTYRYEHRMTTQFHTDKTLQAVLAVMFLRGPQTINELFSRTQRTALFSGIDDIENALDRLIDRATPLVKLIPRQPGQREDRYAHLLCGEPKTPLPSVVKERTVTTTQSVNLEQRVEALESQLKELQMIVEQLKEQQVDS